MKKLLGIVVLGLLLVNLNFINYSFAFDPNHFSNSKSWRKSMLNMGKGEINLRPRIKELEDEIRRQGSKDFSEYWSLSTLGPKSQNEAIKLFEETKLDPIEGIWKESNYDYLLVFIKFESNYRIYFVDEKRPEFNGCWMGTLKKSINSKKFEFYSLQTPDESWGIEYVTVPGHMVLINNNHVNWKLNETTEMNESSGSYTRVWPSDLETWNSKIKTVKKTTNDSSEKDKLLEQLKVLNELYKEGNLTDEEFSKAKKKLLN